MLRWFFLWTTYNAFVVLAEAINNRKPQLKTHGRYIALPFLFPFSRMRRLMEQVIRIEICMVFIFVSRHFDGSANVKADLTGGFFLIFHFFATPRTSLLGVWGVSTARLGWLCDARYAQDFRRFFSFTYGRFRSRTEPHLTTRHEFIFLQETSC